MKSIYLLFIISFVISCQSPEKKETVDENKNKQTDSIVAVKTEISDEDKCVSLIDTLPEIEALVDNIAKNSQEKNHLTIWIAADPSETKIKYYWVKVGEDNGENIATLYNFYVDPKLDQVLYYDVVNDTLITLEEWRSGKFKTIFYPGTIKN